MNTDLKGLTSRIIALTPGEPAGIGPDLTVMLAQTARDYPLVVIADINLLVERAVQLNLPLHPHRIEHVHDIDAIKTAAQHISVLHIPLGTPAKAGKLDIANSHYVVETLTRAAQGCMRGEFGAVVTGPVQKSVINEAGVAFSGHTEFFADYSQTPNVVMMLACESLRVALATTHLPLKAVSDAITQDSLSEVVRILLADLQVKFAIPQPRVLVCGLNPHAGEDGHLGDEEITTITPVLDRFRAQGHDVVGPLPADTLFNPHYLDNADAVLAMYHDQGLPVLKHVGFGNAVNITLGLPFIRTSVDHGTALDLAGSGNIDLGSLWAALEQANMLVNAKRLHTQIA